jgi:hypothetical protein
MSVNGSTVFKPQQALVNIGHQSTILVVLSITTVLGEQGKMLEELLFDIGVPSTAL